MARACLNRVCALIASTHVMKGETHVPKGEPYIVQSYKLYSPTVVSTVTVVLQLLYGCTSTSGAAQCARVPCTILIYLQRRTSRLNNSTKLIGAGRHMLQCSPQLLTGRLDTMVPIRSSPGCGGSRLTQNP